MKLIALIELLQRLSRERGMKIYSLRDLSVISGVSKASMGMTLLRAQKQGLVFRSANTWVNRLDPPPLQELALALRSPSYVSLESALYLHGILSQSPRGALTLVTTKRPGEVETPWGLIRYFHLKSILFFGYDENRMAYAEKAWLDLVYLRGRSGRENILTETFYPRDLKLSRLREFSKNFPAWVEQISMQLRRKPA